MSYPFSLCIYTPIQSDLFGINLEKPLKSAWAFADWDALDVTFSDADVAVTDSLMPRSAADYLRNLRTAGRQTRGWHFAQNPRTRYLTAVLPHWTNDWTRLLLGLNVLRQVLPTAGDGQPGYILAHRFDDADSKTLGAVLMRHGTSKAFGPRASVTAKVVDHATPLAMRVRAMAKMPKPHIVDELDALGIMNQPA